MKKFKLKNIYKVVFVVLVIISVLALATKLLKSKQNTHNSSSVNDVSIQVPNSNSEEIIGGINQNVAVKDGIEQQIPPEKVIDMPFISQAPFGIWDSLHEDACEEASLLMLKYFLDGKMTQTKEAADRDIKSMISYEEKNGYGLSVTLDQLNKIAADYLGLKNGKIKRGITIEEVKKEIAQGNPVIVGAAGKLLHNPNFKNGGPNYHMLVIKGYDQPGFLTNDPGTRSGENYHYNYSTLFSAIHDYSEPNIEVGGKNILIFEQ